MIGGDGGVLSTPPVPESHVAPLERVLLFLQRLFRPLRQWRGWERISQWEALRAIRNSASLRAASYLAAVSMVLILVAGTIVATQLRSSVFESRRTAVLSDAALRFSTAQSVFDQSLPIRFKNQPGSLQPPYVFLPRVLGRFLFCFCAPNLNLNHFGLMRLLTPLS